LKPPYGDIGKHHYGLPVVASGVSRRVLCRESIASNLNEPEQDSKAGERSGCAVSNATNHGLYAYIF
jgi:hypothetical protein